VKILIVGGGAREHAFAWKLSRERTVTGIVCAPGNPGIARSPAASRLIPANRRARHREARKADPTVVGPEVPLSRGT
jgi:phosphoribosylamine--glycine ligase